MPLYVTAQEIADCVYGVVEGDKDAKIYGLALPFDSKQEDLTFIGNTMMLKKISQIDAHVMITPPFVKLPKGKTYIKTARAIEEILDKLILFLIDKGIYKKYVQKVATIATTAKISSNSIIGKNTSIGEGSIIENFVSIGDHVSIGTHCHIKSGVSIEEGTCIGNHVMIESGTKIGVRSFEYGQREGEWVRIPNIGAVIIGDYVDIGANTTVERGTIGNTVIGRGTKIGNLVEIAHEVKIGEDCKIVAHTALAGWVSIGNNTIIYGQCGVSNHVHIGNHVVVLAKSGVTKDIEDGQVVSGFPASDHSKQMRFQAALKMQMKKRGEL